MVGQKARGQDAVQKLRVARDGELEPDARNALGLPRRAHGRLRAGQRLELFDADARPPGTAFVLAEDERHHALDRREQRVDVVGWDERLIR
jgi:hypothetical protein